MKGRIELRFIAPNTSKLRSRVENPSEDLSAKVRSFITEAIAEVAEASQFEVKAKILKRIAAEEAAGNIKFNNPQHRAQVFDLTGDIFTTAFAPTKEAFEVRFPSEKSEKESEEASEGKEKEVGKKKKEKAKKEESEAEGTGDETKAPADEFDD